MSNVTGPDGLYSATRRNFIKAAGAIGLVTAISAPALAQSRRKVTMVAATPSISGSDLGFFSSIPLGLGLFAEEGLDVELVTVNGSGAATNMLFGGQAAFTTHGGAGLFAAVGQKAPIKAFMCQVPDDIYSIAVLENGPINTIADLKGKRIGIASFGGTPHVLMKAIVRQQGWNPDTDMTYIAVGTDVPALDALNRNRIDAIFSYDTAFATFEFNGAKLHYFRPDPLPRTGISHVTCATIDTLEKQPELVRAMSKALARSLVYMAAADPSELTKLHFKVYPEAASVGLSRDQLAQVDRLKFNARIKFMHFKERVFDRSEKIGDVKDAQIELLRDLLLQSGTITQAPEPARYFTRDFIAAMNDINFEADIAKAKSYRFQ
ncbi:ABC transporter substrate-binding protein [Rhizobium puerariae]|uniref:ABC transporter substrate-binding protein n=1 Tax=Rhizobium puerariae TaxID=1585791 RepID=A0ABV6AMT9_9HYPH